MYKNECREISGEYVIVWNENKQIILGPEQFYGTLFCPINFHYTNTLDELEEFIKTNELVLSNTNIDG